MSEIQIIFYPVSKIITFIKKKQYLNSSTAKLLFLIAITISSYFVKEIKKKLNIKKQ